MDINLSVNIILIIQAALIIFGIIIYYRLEKKIRLYQEHSLKVQSDYLDKFSDALKKSLGDYASEFRKSVSVVQESIKYLKQEQKDYLHQVEIDYKDLVKQQNSEFNEFTNDILLDYEEYKKDTERLNKYFGELTEGVKTSLENYDKLIPILDENYKKLEQISDKTKELISDHQKSVKDQNEKMDEILNGLKDQTRDTITQLKSDTEKEITSELNSAKAIISEIMDKSNQIFDKISSKTKNEMEKIAALGEKKLKTSLEHATIIRLSDIINGMEKKLTAMNEATKKNFINLEKKINDSKSSLETKLTEVKSKRRFF